MVLLTAIVLGPRPRPRAPGIVPFAVLMVAVLIWSLSSALAIVQESDRALSFWHRASYLGSALLPAA